ncbi:DNA primase catalytic subunit PriS [Methanocaldococcus indicus]|uniref:DNA primase catalytic subunit PriS n=1 Tax=Methanocaldococcus indicus TaxID=213231 RepID=UPI003C6D2F39
MENIINRLYKKYYLYAIKNNILEVPEFIEYREFGYGKKNKVDNRNISFKNEKEYKSWILNIVPYHIYKSLAIMRYPSNSGGADKKGVIRREIAFDLDIKKTKRCNHDDNWICKYCLEEGKKQTLYLIEEFLFPDFGFDEEDIKIVFSGNRGYHIYLSPKNENIKEIIEHYSKDERRFLTSYILGENLTLKNVGFGWRRRIAKKLKEKGIIKNEKKFLNNKNLESIIKKYKETTQNKIYKTIEELKSIELDKKVMEDDIRLLRVINSLHGYTGFIVKELTYKELKTFNPLKDAIFEEFENIFFDVDIVDNKKFSIEINGKKYTNKSKKLTASALLFLYGHNIKFNIHT